MHQVPTMHPCRGRGLPFSVFTIMTIWQANLLPAVRTNVYSTSNCSIQGFCKFGRLFDKRGIIVRK